jgi:hypothetical protein
MWCGTYHGVNQFDAVILRWVVAGSNHDADPLSTKLLGAKTSKQSDGENDGVEKITSRKRVLEV